VQDPALDLIEPHTVGLGPLIQPVQIPLQSLPTLQQINTLTQLGVICELIEAMSSTRSSFLGEDSWVLIWAFFSQRETTSSSATQHLCELLA